MTTQKTNLKELENVTTSQVFQTGLVEIGIGLVFIVSSVSMIFDDIRYYLNILFIVPVIFMIISIKYIAEPRMGIVNFSRQHVRKRNYFIAAITTFLVIMVALTFFGEGNVLSQIVNPSYVITGIIFFICIAVAYFMNFNRMYIYAFLLAGAFNWTEVIRENPGVIANGAYAYIIISLLLIIIGSIYLVRFLKSNPLPNTNQHREE